MLRSVHSINCRLQALHCLVSRQYLRKIEKRLLHHLVYARGRQLQLNCHFPAPFVIGLIMFPCNRSPSGGSTAWVHHLPLKLVRLLIVRKVLFFLVDWSLNFFSRLLTPVWSIVECFLFLSSCFLLTRATFLSPMTLVRSSSCWGCPYSLSQCQLFQ